MAVIRGSTQGTSTTLAYLTSGTHLRGGLSVVENIAKKVRLLFHSVTEVLPPSLLRLSGARLLSPRRPVPCGF